MHLILGLNKRKRTEAHTFSQLMHIY